MVQHLNVETAQEQAIKVAGELHLIIHRLKKQHQRLDVSGEAIETYYTCRDSGKPPSIQVVVSEEIDMAVDQLLTITGQLERASRITEASIRAEWRLKKKQS